MAKCWWDKLIVNGTSNWLLSSDDRSSDSGVHPAVRMHAAHLAGAVSPD
jgi:hypothetical protein